MLHRTKCLNVEVTRIITFYGSLSRSSTLYHLHSSDRINYRKRKAGIRLRRERERHSAIDMSSRIAKSSCLHTHTLVAHGWPKDEECSL